MGFDVIYFPPIHPIGQTNRKGPNSSITCEPGDPGSPWAIGSKAGGHKAIEPALGTLADFDWLVAEVRKRGMEIALDFALNCSPDHPYVKEHPDWFYRRPDGSIKYAENPPKKCEDIYPLNFRCKNWRALWAEMKSIVLFGRTTVCASFGSIIRTPSQLRSGNISLPASKPNIRTSSFSLKHSQNRK